MGLDMYLTKRVYVGGYWEHRKATGGVDIKFGTGEKKIKIPATEVKEVVLHVGQWRKANQIHQWFVENVQDGRDECQEAYVDPGTLGELKQLCEKALKTKDATLLPPVEGCFFGGTEVDAYYWQDIKDTIKILDKIEDRCDYYYQSSW